MAEMRKHKIVILDGVDILRREGGSRRNITPPTSSVDRRLPIWQVTYGKNGKQVLFYDIAGRP